MNITIVGLGYIGLPVAIRLAEAGLIVNGYEINEDRLKEIKSGTFNYHEKDLYSRFDIVQKSITLSSEFPISDIYIVTVQTPLDGKNKADLSYVMNALKKVGENLKKNDLVILESTVPPKSNNVFMKYLSEKSSLGLDQFDYVYCPETILPGNALNELASNSRVIGANDKKAYKRAYEIYSLVTKGKITHTSFLVAEHVKILQNAYRDYEIAFANELSIYCDKNDIDVYELINLVNDHPRAKILSPGIGVGGHCLPIDPLFILEQTDFEPIRMSRRINDYKTEYVLQKVLDSKSKNVIIFGATYKPNSDDLRHSPSVIIAKKLRSNGVNAYFCEPNIKDEEILGFKNYSFSESINKGYLLVIAQRHNHFYENRSFFEKRYVMDYVGLLSGKI